MAAISGSVNRLFGGQVGKKSNIDAHQYSLILPQKGYAPLPTVRATQQGQDLQQYPPQKTHKSIEAIALSNRVIQATHVGDGRYIAEVRLRVPIELTRSEIERLLDKTARWPGWTDDPRHSLSELGTILEAAIATVGGAQ